MLEPNYDTVCMQSPYSTVRSYHALIHNRVEGHDFSMEAYTNFRLLIVERRRRRGLACLRPSVAKAGLSCRFFSLDSASSHDLPTFAPIHARA